MRPEPPHTISLWTKTIAWLLARLPDEERALLLANAAIAGTPLTALSEGSLADRSHAEEVLSRTLHAWLAGQPLVEVGRILHAEDEPIAVTRGKGHALPRTLRFMRDGIEHSLTSVAGAMLAVVVTGAEHESDGPWSLAPGPLGELARLPVALRYGSGDPAALALLQAGLRPRVIAHLLARLAPPPPGAAEDTLALWAWQTLRDLETVELLESVEDPGEREALRAAAHVRRSL